MTKSKRVIFFGTEDFSLPSLEALLEHDYDVVAVVTKPDSARGRSRRLVEPAVKCLAKSYGITVFQPARLADIDDELAELKADIGVLVSYGKILPDRTLKLFGRFGIVNLHPSLLPKYRGPSPIETAIKNDDAETGVSLIKLTRDMDAGPIYDQTTVKLTGSETKPELYDRLARLGAERLVACLPAILDGQLEAKPQSNQAVTYTTLLSKDMAEIDPSTDNAYAIERQVRAYLGFPKTKLKLENNVVIITSAKVVDKAIDDQLVLDCADQTYLLIEQLVAPSGKSMTGQAYRRGYQIGR
ncbi:MAG TPA: methionyl-tRNA formyltransferase [Candidatus Saccharimonadales bacterium]|nr:methionyl-tRNA formyltransferase [Candidatus Saccharimonadales bacterium]